MELNPDTLFERYRRGDLLPSEVARHVLARLDADDQAAVWISTCDPDTLIARARALDERVAEMDNLSLFGLPFNVKDCIDVAGEYTTAACPGYRYLADTSAPAVAKALDAGALFVGKTNMDQFATGLVGTRSPYGTPRNPHNGAYIPGGSSSGTAVSVATGSTAFGLGTDTGGSGRVPAAYCGITGLKPAPGTVSRRGMVAACRSFDTVSVFAATPAHARDVLAVIAGYDAADPFSVPGQRLDDLPVCSGTVERLRVAIPAWRQLEFFGDSDTEALFAGAVERVENLLGPVGELDFAPLSAVGELMFHGPFAAERDASVGTFLDAEPDAAVDVVRRVILDSRRFSAKDACLAQYRIAETRRWLHTLWRHHDVILLPTVGTQVTLEDVARDPLTPNVNNGFYTNFANPLGFAAISVPAGRTRAGVPFGVTFYARPGGEFALSRLATRFLE